MNGRRTGSCAALVAVLAAGGACQLPGNAIHVAASHGELAGQSLVAFDASGAITSLMPPTGATALCALGMSPLSDELFVRDRDRRHDFHPAQGGQFYQVALWLGHAPGLRLGAAGTPHLRNDSLLWFSVAAGPPVFHHFTGVLDARGRAEPAPCVVIPASFDLQGVRVFGGAVAYDAQGVTAVRNGWGITRVYT